MAVLDKLHVKVTGSFVFSLPVGIQLRPLPVGPDRVQKYLILVERDSEHEAEEACAGLLAAVADALGIERDS